MAHEVALLESGEKGDQGIPGVPGLDSCAQVGGRGGGWGTRGGPGGGRAPQLTPDADWASGCRPQCFMERERPRAEEARVSGPPSSPRLLPRVPRGCSHSLSIPLQGDNHEGDPGCAGSPGLPGPPGLPGQRGEEVRAWAGPRGGWCLHLNEPRFLRAVSSCQWSPWTFWWLLVSPWESLRGH